MKFPRFFPNWFPLTRETLASDRASQDQPVGRMAMITLLVALIPVLGPHTSHLPEWCIAFGSVLFGWRALLTWRERVVPIKIGRAHV